MPSKSLMIQFCLVGLAYFVLAALTVSFTRFDGGAAFIWLSSGVLLAQLALLPWRQWLLAMVPAAIAMFVMASVFGLGVKAAPMMTAANMSEPLIAALCLRWLNGPGLRIDTIRAIAIFLLSAGIVGPALSASGGAAGISIVTGGAFWPNWFHWFAAHGLGTTLCTPMAFVVLSGGVRRWSLKPDKTQTAPALALVLVLAICVVVFRQHSLPILFLPFLPMTLATICGGRAGAIGSCIILAVVGGVYTAQGSGPVNLMEASVGVRALFLQAYVGCAALLVLPVAALLRQRHNLTRQLAHSEARYRAIADSLGDAVVDVTIDGMIRYASPAIAAMAGIAPDQLIGQSAKSLVFEADLAGVWQAHEKALAFPGQAFRAQYRGADISTPRWFEVMIRAAQSADGMPLGVVGSIRDITERKDIESRLHQAARTDALTGISNRRAFEEMMIRHLEQLKVTPGPASLALFDLDHFKAINDTYGHAAGDIVLKAVAQATRAQLREVDMVARVGGEEFAVVFWNLEREQAELAARRLRSAINDLVIPVPGNSRLGVTASMGLADIRAGERLTDLLQRSDVAMYEAKRGGRNCLRIAA